MRIEHYATLLFLSSLSLWVLPSDRLSSGEAMKMSSFRVTTPRDTTIRFVVFLLILIAQQQGIIKNTVSLPYERRRFCSQKRKFMS